MMDAPAENFPFEGFTEQDPSGATETVQALSNAQHNGQTTSEGTSEKRWPGWPGESVFRILVPTPKVGGIIGRKGEFIKKMCEESKARIKVLDGPPVAPERIVLISAKEETNASISPAMDGLLRVHKRIVDGLDGEQSNGTTNPGIVVKTRLLAAASQAGSLIGKQGSTIKSIQDSSNCVVRILDDVPPIALREDRIVEIQGGPTGVHKAVELIAGQLRRFLVDRTVLPLFEVNMAMSSSNMEQNMPPSWAHPAGIPPNAGGPFGGNPPFMPSRPPLDNYYPPPELRPLDKQPHHGVSAYGRDPPPMSGNSANQHAAVISQVTQHMQIPLSYADAVIGASGASISYIRRASGATISIQETRGVPGEMTVEINGSASQVQTAQQLIQNFMAEASVPAQNNTAPADPGYGYPSRGSNAYMSGPGSAGPGAHGGGYGSSYGTNYGY